MTQSTPWDPGACMIRPRHPAHFHCQLGTACKALGSIVRHLEGGWPGTMRAASLGGRGRPWRGASRPAEGGRVCPGSLSRGHRGLVPASTKPALLWAESWHMGGMGRATNCPLQRTPPPAPEPQCPGMGVGKLTSGIGWHVRSGLHRPHLRQDGLLAPPPAQLFCSRRHMGVQPSSTKLSSISSFL